MRREPWADRDLLDPQGHLENLTDQKKVLLENLAHRENLEKMVLLVFLALRDPKAAGASPA